MMGAIIGALVVGLVVVVFLLLNNQGTTVANNPPVNAPVAQATTNVGSNPNTAPEPTAMLAPRMTLAEFKALYDDPARRPMVVDVRAAEAFQQGHIQGAVNIPEADVATRLAEFPKDKLIVAYCQ